jgi:hypothetical protein
MMRKIIFLFFLTGGDFKREIIMPPTRLPIIKIKYKITNIIKGKKSYELAEAKHIVPINKIKDKIRANNEKI